VLLHNDGKSRDDIEKLLLLFSVLIVVMRVTVSVLVLVLFIISLYYRLSLYHA